MQMFRQALFRLGAFDFENWYWSIFAMSDSSCRTDRNIHAMTFIDSPETIVFNKVVCLLGDGNFCNRM
jgi:hypothetical protein